MKFQVSIDESGIKQRAMNVESVRDVFRGKIESLKGQVCLVSSLSFVLRLVKPMFVNFKVYYISTDVST